MKELVEAIARALVDHPEDVQVQTVEGSQVTVLELRVHPEDLGKVIGRQGRTAKAVRTLLGAAGMKLKRRFTLEILGDCCFRGRFHGRFWLPVSLEHRNSTMDPGGAHPSCPRQYGRSRGCNPYRFAGTAY